MNHTYNLRTIVMSRDELTLFSYEILGLVGRQGASAHDLMRLARLGYLAAAKAPGRTRERTVYTLTDRGREAIRAYARTPVRITPLKSEPLLRLLLADLAGDVPPLDGLRDDVAELRAQLDAAAERSQALPHRRGDLLLGKRFLHRLLDLHLELADAVERR